MKTSTDPHRLVLVLAALAACSGSACSGSAGSGSEPAAQTAPSEAGAASPEATSSHPEAPPGHPAPREAGGNAPAAPTSGGNGNGDAGAADASEEAAPPAAGGYESPPVGNVIVEGPTTWMPGMVGLVKDINTTAQIHSNPTELIEVGGALYFTANDGVHGRELWRTDGTGASTTLVADLSPNTSTYEAFGPKYLTEVFGSLYVNANDGVKGEEVWRVPGSVGAPARVSDIYAGVSNSYPRSFTAFESGVFFSAFDGADNLWFSSGSLQSTRKISTNPGQVYSLMRSGPRIFFDGIGTDAAGNNVGRELWKVEAGVVSLVKDLRPGPDNSTPSSLTDMEGVLYFTTDSGTRLWRSDGTPSGTLLLKELAGQPNIRNLYAVGQTLFFVAGTLAEGTELWRSDGTAAGTRLAQDLWPGAVSSFPDNFLSLGGVLYFSARGANVGGELWRFDPAGNVAELISDITPGAYGSDPDWLRKLDEKNLVFAASDPSYGRELWISDGTTGGTRRLTDVRPGIAGSMPRNVTVLGTEVYFTADDGVAGYELWRISLAPSCAVPASPTTIDEILGSFVEGKQAAFRSYELLATGRFSVREDTGVLAQGSFTLAGDQVVLTYDGVVPGGLLSRLFVRRDCDGSLALREDRAHPRDFKRSFVVCSGDSDSACPQDVCKWEQPVCERSGCFEVSPGRVMCIDCGWPYCAPR